MREDQKGGESYLGNMVPSSGGGGQTINNEDITITQNGEYSASEGYTGIGKATVNVPQGDIVTATNNTGSAIALGNKVWLEKSGNNYVLNNIYKPDKNHRWFKDNGISVDDTTGVATGFSSSGLEHAMSIDFTKPWTFHTHVKTPTSIGNNFIYSGDVASEAGAMNMGFWLRIDTSQWEIRFNSQSSLIVSGGGTVTTNKEYWLQVGWTGEEYFGRVSEDGANYADFGTRIQATTPCTQTGSSFILGFLKWFTANWGNGSIYMAETFFENVGMIAWRGYFPQITESTLTGIANANIANGATGSVKTILGE